ncbi:MAG: acyltransferase family protein [Pseudomonadota bacterium]
MQYRLDIDALRGISILLVVVYHTFPAALPGGFVGVDVFFVISGFLITGLILEERGRGQFTFSGFYARRIRRLFPALIVVLGAGLGLGWLVLYPDELQQLASHTVYAAVFLLNFELIGETGYFDVDAVYKPLLHLWSLSIEEQFYLFWPTVLFLFSRGWPLWIVMAAIFIGSLWANVLFVAEHPDSTYLHTGARIWQLVAGAMLALYRFDSDDTMSRPYLAWLGLACVTVAAFGYNDTYLYPGWSALLPTLGSVFLIAANVKLKGYLWFERLGLISYPLYLWHWMLISIATIYTARQIDNWQLLVVVFLAVLLSFLTYRYIERLRHIKSGMVPIGLVLALGAVASVALFLDSRSGLPDRPHIAIPTGEFERTPATDALCEDYVALRKVERSFFYCRGANLTSDKLIALVGDSHAHALFPGLSEVAQESGHGVLLLANSSCPPFEGFEWGRNPPEIERCQQSIAQIIGLVQGDARFHTVLLTTRGPRYIHGEVEGTYTEANVALAAQRNINERQTYVAFAQGLRRTVLALSEPGRDVFYLLENPEMDFLPKETLVRPFDYFDVSSRRAVTSRSAHDLRMTTYRNEVAAVRKATGVQVVDPTNWFCDAKHCRAIVNGVHMYADDDHFSVSGSRYVAERLEPYLSMRLP